LGDVFEIFFGFLEKIDTRLPFFAAFVCKSMRQSASSAPKKAIRVALFKVPLSAHLAFFAKK